MRRCFRPLWSKTDKVRCKTNLVSIRMVGSGVEEDDQHISEEFWIGFVGGKVGVVRVASATWSSEGGVS